jgi:hypothetical protein
LGKAGFEISAVEAKTIELTKDTHYIVTASKDGQDYKIKVSEGVPPTITSFPGRTENSNRWRS